MPKLPWASINEVDADTDVTIMGSRLPLRSHLAIPGFMLATQRIRKQLKNSEGLVGYALDARLLDKTFWTVSAWVGREHLQRFNRADPHHAATRAIRPKMEPSTFVFWSGKARDLPVPWNEVERRITEREAERTPTHPAEPPATPDEAEG